MSITKEKLEELRKRMLHHSTINGMAIVVLTARELENLLEIADKHFEEKVDPFK